LDDDLRLKRLPEHPEALLAVARELAREIGIGNLAGGYPKEPAWKQIQWETEHLACFSVGAPHHHDALAPPHHLVALDPSVLRTPIQTQKLVDNPNRDIEISILHQSDGDRVTIEVNHVLFAWRHSI